MTARVDINIDLDAARAAMKAGAGKGVGLATEYLLTEANKHVPHEDGPLERSGATSVDGTRGAVSYDTPYAVVQHEDMELTHDGKGEAKWLEKTMGTESKVVGRIIATAIAGEVG